MDIFLSYRRQDAAGYALGLKREFTRAFPDVQLFLDVQSLDAGMRWRDEIQKRIERCDVMLVIIGDEWLLTRDGNKKIDSPDDPVRLELETALARQGGIQIIPVLVEEACMPSARELPDQVKGLCEYNAHPIHDKTYDQDVNVLVERLTELFAEQAGTKQRARPRALSPEVSTSSPYPSKITDRYLREEVSGMGRDQLLALIAELLRRGWTHEDVFENALRFSPLKPPKKLPARITPVWLATNVPLLSPARIDKLVSTLRDRGWRDEDIRTYVWGNRQAGLASPLPKRISVSWVEANAPLMTPDEQTSLADALLQRGWSADEIHYYLPAFVGS